MKPSTFLKPSKCPQKRIQPGVKIIDKVLQRYLQLINGLDIQSLSRINEGWVESKYSVCVSTDGRVAKVSCLNSSVTVFCVSANNQKLQVHGVLPPLFQSATDE